MKLISEDNKELPSHSLEILADRKEIEVAIMYLQDILKGIVPNEAIFVNASSGGVQTITVSLIEK